MSDQIRLQGTWNHVFPLPKGTYGHLSLHAPAGLTLGVGTMLTGHAKGLEEPINGGGADVQ